jgi:hypothetical protein
MLSRRLAALVDAGMLERRPYSVHPPRDEYVLTDRGRDFHDVLIALLAFGNRHFAPEGETIRWVDAATDAPADPVVVDRHTGRRVAEPLFRVAPGPAATEATKQRIARRAARTAARPGAPKERQP